MASAAPASGWLRGKGKTVSSGDSLLIMGRKKTAAPLKRHFTLASIIAPKLEVTFPVDYTVRTINREFGSVFIGDKNVAYMVVAEGWAKTPGALGDPMWDLPPSAIGYPSNFDAMALLATNKGKPMEAFVEQVRDQVHVF